MTYGYKPNTGRPAITEKFFMYFYCDLYIKDLRVALRRSLVQVKRILRDRMKDNARGLPFKTNEVKLAGGDVTSDRMRRSALIESIVDEKVDWISANVLATAVTAMGNNFAESHIGIYYEFGTGIHAENVPWVGALVQDKNPYRTGREIVSRSIYKVGEEGGERVVKRSGVWRDLGGNLRVTNSPRGGERDSKFVQYVGEDVMAHRWFRDAFKQVRPQIEQEIRKAIASVNPFMYMHISNTYNLTKTRGLAGRDVYAAHLGVRRARGDGKAARAFASKQYAAVRGRSIGSISGPKRPGWKPTKPKGKWW